MRQAHGDDGPRYSRAQGPYRRVCLSKPRPGSPRPPSLHSFEDPLYLLRTTTLALAIASALAATLPAQLGRPTGEQFDAQATLTTALGGTWDGVQGVVRTIGNRYWVSVRQSAPTVSLRLAEFDADGAYLQSVTLPAALTTSATGLLDLAYDSVNNVIYGGCEHVVSGRQLFAFHVATATFEAGGNIPVPATAPGSAVRGLTYDRFGNASQGSFFAVDGNSTITEFTRSGAVLRTLANPHQNATALALDDTYRLLWVFGPGGSTKAGEGVVGMAVDATSGLSAGQMVLGDAAYAGTPNGGNVTGAEFTAYAHDHAVYRLALATNANSDWVYELEGRFAYGATCGGSIGFAGDAAYAGNAGWRATLAGSSATTAFLMLAGTKSTTAVGMPLFAAGCNVLLGLATPPLAIGGAPVTGGNATLGVPIPGGVTGTVYFQWVEAPAAGTPLRLSDGGSIFLRF